MVRKFVAEFAVFILPASSFWDRIFGNQIDGAPEEGFELRSKIKNNYGYYFLLVRNLSC